MPFEARALEVLHDACAFHALRRDRIAVQVDAARLLEEASELVADRVTRRIEVCAVRIVGRRDVSDGERRLTLAELIAQQAQLNLIGRRIRGMVFEPRLLEILDRQARGCVDVLIRDREAEARRPAILFEVRQEGRVDRVPRLAEVETLGCRCRRLGHGQTRRTRQRGHQDGHQGKAAAGRKGRSQVPVNAIHVCVVRK